MLKAYAQTHGYKFDDVVNRSYDIQTKVGDNINTYSQYDIYLPVTDAPAQTPEQAAGMQPPSLEEAPEAVPAAAGSAPAPANSSAAPAEAASANQ
jgi:hypothetical protein